MWKWGSEQHFMTPLRRDPRDRLEPYACSKLVFREREAVLLLFQPPPALLRQRTAKGSPRTPQRMSKGTPKESKGAQSRPKGRQRHPKGTPKEPKGAQSRPKGGQRHTKDTQGKPKEQDIYLQTPDQPPKRTLCYCIMVLSHYGMALWCWGIHNFWCSGIMVI